MTRRGACAAAVLALVVGLGGCGVEVGGAADADDEANAEDARAIRGALEQWPRDWNARDTAAVCALFSSDVVLQAPGSPDRDHARMCAGFAALFARDDRTLRYDPPAIEEILVDGDLATVRLVWTGRTTGEGIAGELVEREKGVDVFRRQPDGRWRIHISHAFPAE